MQELRIHIASPEWAADEYTKIQEFYEKNRDSGNSIRDPEILMKSIEDNKAYLITDKVSGDLVGVSFCFTNGDGDFTESGGTRILKNGYGLQTVISFVKTMHEFMLDPPLHEYYCVIKEKNQKSIDNMASAYFVEWTPTQALIELRQHSSLEGRHFFYLPRNKLLIVRDQLLGLIAKPVIAGKYGAPDIKIDFDIGIVKTGALNKDTTFDHLDDRS